MRAARAETRAGRWLATSRTETRPRSTESGVSRCRLLSVDGLDLKVLGPDAIADTPILEIKPWFDEFGPRGEPTLAIALNESFAKAHLFMRTCARRCRNLPGSRLTAVCHVRGSGRSSPKTPSMLSLAGAGMVP